MKKKLLITGISGLLGSNLAFALRDKYDIAGWYNHHEVFIPGVNALKVDITDKQLVKESVSDFSPDIILHCASLTNIDYCENNKEETKRVNVEGTRNIVSACGKQDIKLVYISTDAVYDGEKGHYSENDPVSPCNYYGLTKYEAEGVVKEHKNYIIVRTNIFGWNIQNKHSLAEWILYNLERGCCINGFSDALFSSIYTMDFARVIDKMLDKDLMGIFNLASRTSVSKYDFAKLIARFFSKDSALIKPISINDYNFVAKRGKDLSLNVQKLSKVLDQDLPSTEECVSAFFKDYKNELCDEVRRCCYSKTSYPVLDFISYGRQSIDDTDIDEVVKVLKSSNLTQGSKIEEFEQALCKYVGAKYAVAVSNGTAALHIACLSAGLKDGDEFVTSPNTFVASANCGIYCGARPVFADIREDTYNIDPKEIETKINAKTKAIIPVHFAGQICDLEEIKNIVEQKQVDYKNKIFIIEDASHALGSVYKGTKAGSCVYSDMTVMSFHPVKHITTGEGGVVFTNDEKLYKKLKLLRSHGITNNEEELIFKDQAYGLSGLNPWYYEQQVLGFNYRITDIQCALGISQLEKIDYFLRRRRKIFETYNKAFAGNKFIKVPFESLVCFTNWHLYVLQIDFSALGKNRKNVMRELRDGGVGTQVHYIPVHTQPFYKVKFGTNWGDLMCAEEYYYKCLSIPLYPSISDSDINKVIKSVLSVF
ncbi:MAG: UDP-4-amino-4,6-dideoxy-N-acetyl-beta-L-altrosamine transaminase [Candidatus Omnitrophota bacterium]